MAKGSEQFTWKAYGNPPAGERVCGACSKPLRVVDVGRIDNVVDARGAFVTTFYCTEHRRAA